MKKRNERLAALEHELHGVALKQLREELERGPWGDEASEETVDLARRTRAFLELTR